MSDLLLELFSEEIPARMQEDALAHLQKALLDGLQKEQFSITSAQFKGFVTPRRLSVCIRDLPQALAASETEIKGPKVGAPEAALQGFLKKNALNAADLTERDGTYFAVLRKEGRATSELLQQLIESILQSFPWSKSMRWGNNDVTWVRPLHSMICLFDNNIVPVRFGNISAGNSTQGHRFLSQGAIMVGDSNQYEALLEKACVLADRDKRKQRIADAAAQAAASLGLSVKRDDGLLEEVTGLVEWPVVLVGRIDEQFMDLPPEVLTTVMRSHQKYFALLDAQGRLAPQFLIISNMKTADNGQAIIAGNERVLRARFSDARFFWDQDRKKPLSDWAEGLKSVTYHAKLGSIADKVERIKHMAELLIKHGKFADDLRPMTHDQVQRAVALCKADLVTGMVGEFAELQGVMGRYYALQQQEAPEVADAIRDHYKPQGPNDSVPANIVGTCVALADKLDTLVSMFSIGEKPTGSKDPFALRRMALGIIRIILENQIRLKLSVILSEAKNRVQHRQDPSPVAQDGGLFSFIIDRLKVQLKDQGIRHDVINAVVADGDDDLVRIVARAKALQDFLQSEDGVNLLVAYRRAVNILAIEEKKDNIKYHSTDESEMRIEETLLVEPAEKELFKQLQEKRPKIYIDCINEKFEGAMKLLASLRAPVDVFFDNIMVNSVDRKLRINRLHLLSYIRVTMNHIADFSKIEG